MPPAIKPPPLRRRQQKSLYSPKPRSRAEGAEGKDRKWLAEECELRNEKNGKLAESAWRHPVFSATWQFRPAEFLIPWCCCRRTENPLRTCLRSETSLRRHRHSQ